MTKIRSLGNIIGGSCSFVAAILSVVTLFIVGEEGGFTLGLIVVVGVPIFLYLGVKYCFSYVCYDDEKLFVKMPFGECICVNFSDIIYVWREKQDVYVKGSTQVSYKWCVCYFDKEENEEKRVRIMLPNNFEDVRNRMLFSAIKAVKKEVQIGFSTL